MKEPALHIVFGAYGAKTLRKDIQDMWRPNEVVSFDDDLSYGPIEPLDPLARWAWVRREFRHPPQDRARFVRTEAFWEAALSASRRRIVWMTRHYGDEYAGFLEFVSRLDDDSPCEVIDLTELEIEARLPGHRVVRRLPSLGNLRPFQILQNELWDTARPFTPEARRRYRKIWHKLRKENAPLRLLKNRRLISAPITFFDERLLSCCDIRLRKGAYVIGKVMSELSEEKINVSFDILAGRLRKLVEEDRLVPADTMVRMTHSEVRLADRKQSRRDRLV
jgi:hypothetical protein